TDAIFCCFFLSLFTQFFSIIGMFGNGCIAVIYSIDWVKRRKLSSCDMILTCLGMSRILLQGTFTAHLLISDFAFWISIIHQVQVTTGFLSFSWFASCLSVFYCVKITNFTQPLFLWMKQRISGMISQMLQVSMLLALLTTIPSFWANYDEYLCNATRKFSENTTAPDVNLQLSYFYFILLVTVKGFLPFIIFLGSSVLLIISLWRHTRHMQHNASSFQDPRTEAHVNAIKVLFSCLVLYVCGFVADTVRMFPTCLTDRIWTPGVCSIVVPLYPTVHSIILILINPKLKQASVRILHSVKQYSETTNLLSTATRQ
uniref:Taste receptor type 2 n=1 Tax=Pelusios castaneus TaxID=367368 RepID=A0A8C8S2T0_9SAUR